MIYLVSNQQELFESEEYTTITLEESLDIIKDWKMCQLDSETSGRDSHVNDLLCVQIGDVEGTTQIVIDTSTIDIKKYKDFLESVYCIGHNLKFDLQFLYNYNIIPRKVYDTMIVEQLLYLGYPPGKISYSLKSVAERRLGIDIDKSTRGEIIWRGLDSKVIQYAAGDVQYLGDIMKSQIKDCQKKQCLIGAKIECDFTPAIAYLEWCGIKLDEKKWREKMFKDKQNLISSETKLNNYCISNPKLQKWVYIDPQGDLFTGFNEEPQFNIDWQKDEAKEVFKTLGFDLSSVSKTTGEETESVMEKVISCQKGIDDTFLKLYLDYQGYYKVCSSFGQGHLNAINPNTGRVHTSYKAIGTISGRMSCGSNQINTDLAKLKGLPLNPSAKQKKEGKSCSYPNLQQLPHDAETRSCFVCEEGNVFVSVDWSAMEARIGAEVYNEKTLLDEFLYGSGDSHAAYAKVVFADELKDVDVKDVKKKRPDLRNKVKSIEFAVQFGSDGTAAAPQLEISVEEARKLVDNLLKGMKGLASFKRTAGKQLMDNGYVTILPQTGHKAYWWDYDVWKERQASFTSEFWDNYKLYHKGTKDEIADMVKKHFQAVSKWRDRMSLNLPTQGGGAVCLKEACTTLFNWIVDNNYFGVIKLVNFTHDEINSECPKELKDTYPKLVETIMKDTCAKYFKKLPIPAESSVGQCWIH